MTRAQLRCAELIPDANTISKPHAIRGFERGGTVESMDWSAHARALVRLALDEDLGERGDITTALFDAATVQGRIVARRAGVIAGLVVAPLITTELAARGYGVTVRPALEDGASVAAGEVLAHVSGSLAGVLAAERILLNFLGRMSGVATLTAAYAAAARRGAAGVQVLDTRKTVPGWRALDKYAVRMGGGVNHRFGLHDAVLIKDNHIADVPPAELAAHLRQRLSGLPREARPDFVEVEVDTPAQFEQVCRVDGVTMILLDNFSLDELRGAVRRRDELGLRARLLLEASGGVSLETIATIATTGVDRISVGALTHSAAWLDLALDFDSHSADAEAPRA